MKFLILLALVAAASADYLTADQANTLRGAWDQFKHDEVEILYFIFHAYPDIQSKFPKFHGKDLEEIKGTQDFGIHATRIVQFISDVITLSGFPNNVPAIETLMHDLTKTHKARGITKDQFTEFRTAITNFAKGHSGWSDGVATVWNQALDNVFGLIFKDY